MSEIPDAAIEAFEATLRTWGYRAVPGLARAVIETALPHLSPAPQAEGDVREALAELFIVMDSFAAPDTLADAVLSSGLVVPAAIHKVATDALEDGDACGAVGCRALADRDRANDALDRAHELLVRTRRVVDLPATDPWDRGWRKAHLKIANELHAALDTTPRA